MAIRTTATAVRTIGGFPTSLDVDAFIETASSLVDEVAACAGSKLSDARLELIERWLSAHFAKIMSPDVISKSIAGASVSYDGRGKGGQGLSSTSYGQQALLLDSSGCLLKITSRRPVISWIGTPLSNQQEQTE